MFPRANPLGSRRARTALAAVADSIDVPLTCLLAVIEVESGGLEIHFPF